MSSSLSFVRNDDDDDFLGNEEDKKIRLHFSMSINNSHITVLK